MPYILYFHCNHSPCYHPCITTNIINKHKFQVLVLFFIYICVYNVLKVNWMIVQKASNSFVEDLYTQGSKNCLRRRIHLQFTYSMCSSFFIKWGAFRCNLENFYKRLLGSQDLNNHNSVTVQN